MSEYWIEIHPESPTYIIICDLFLNILKKAGFNTEHDVNVLITGDGNSIIIYKADYLEKQRGRLIGNKITNIEYTDVRNVYKSVTKIPLLFEQEGKEIGTNFDVFVINFVNDQPKNTEKESEDLEDVFV